MIRIFLIFAAIAILFLIEIPVVLVTNPATITRDPLGFAFVSLIPGGYGFVGLVSYYWFRRRFTIQRGRIEFLEEVGSRLRVRKREISIDCVRDVVSVPGYRRIAFRLDSGEIHVLNLACADRSVRAAVVIMLRRAGLKTRFLRRGLRKKREALGKRRVKPKPVL